jgi:hypothetical protein
MPLVRSALIATAACLIGAAAYAQPSASTGDSAPPAVDQSAPQTPSTGNPPGPTGSSDMNAGGPASAPADAGAPPPGPDAGPAPTGAAANTSATVTTDASGTQIVASQPVPDTPANRKAYGKPLSMTGKRTPPVGN